MSSLKKQMKKLEKDQERLAELIKLQRATCPHVSKKGKKKIEEFNDNGVLKGRCKKCGEVILLDEDYLSKEAVQSATETVKTVLAEFRSRVHTGDLKIDDATMRLITSFDAEVLRDLPELMGRFTKAEKKKDKEKRKQKYKENKRRHWGS